MRSKIKVSTIVYHLFVFAFSFMLLYPLAWMISSSFKHTKDVLRTAMELIPVDPTFENYQTVWKGIAGVTFLDFLRNSIIMSITRVVAAVVVTSVTAFAYARIKFAGRKAWFAVMMGTMCLPGMVLQIPRYIMYLEWGWIGSWLPILIPCWFGGGASHIFLQMQFMRGVPKEMDEAARMDGCGYVRLFTTIIVPLIAPILCYIAVMTFIGAWSDFYSALIYLNVPKYYPLAYAVKLYADETGVDYGPIQAMSVLSIIPILIVFFFFQRTLVDGIKIGGVKG